MVTVPLTLSSAPGPTSASTGYLPASALGTCSVTLPLSVVVPWVSSVSQTPLSFLSRQTSAPLIGPSTTITTWDTVVGGSSAASPGLSELPPQADSRAALPNRLPIKALSGRRRQWMWRRRC